MMASPLLLPAPRHMDLAGPRVTPGEPAVVIGAPDIASQGYRLTIASDGAVTIDAADPAGAFYASASLAQLVQVGGGHVPVGTIEDWPDLVVRGVMLDVSRDKVPTLDSLCTLIDRLASWKINQVQLYMEHTFAYRDHETVWRDASPYTPDDIRQLDAFCRDRFVELVPNQNCLGHYERWLRHDRYRDLAISPDGAERFGRLGPPTTLDPAKAGSAALVQGLLHEMLPAFGARKVNVGLDEPWELPRERYDEYVAWTQWLRALPELDGYEMLMWGDILATDPALARGIPDGVTVCEWGYDDWHPFDERCSALRDAGRPFWVSPGTSSWLTILGRWTNARGNIESAACAAHDHGGTGLLNTDWGDLGHLQYPAVSDPGFAYGAAVSWCLETNADLDVAGALDMFRFADGAGELGRVMLDLGDVHRELAAQLPNMSSLVIPLYLPGLHLDRGMLSGVAADQYERVRGRLNDARAAIRRARPQVDDATLVCDELVNAITLVELLCDDASARLEHDGSLESVSEQQRLALAGRVPPIVEEHRRVWLLRNRPGGLDDSVRRLDDLQKGYAQGSTDGLGGW